MLNRTARAALIVLLMAAGQGCLFETVLDAGGGGVMTATLTVAKREDLANTTAQMQSPAVKLTSSEFVSGDIGKGIFKLQFDDVTKLPTARFFKAVSITRSERPDGVKVLTAIVKNQTTEVPDAVIERVDKEVKVIVTFPGDVVESNGSISGRTVTWAWGVKEFYKQPEVKMTAAFKLAAGAAAPAGAVPTPGTKPTPGKVK